MYPSAWLGCGLHEWDFLGVGPREFSELPAQKKYGLSLMFSLDGTDNYHCPWKSVTELFGPLTFLGVYLSIRISFSQMLLTI